MEKLPLTTGGASSPTAHSRRNAKGTDFNRFVQEQNRLPQRSNFLTFCFTLYFPRFTRRVAYGCSPEFCLASPKSADCTPTPEKGRRIRRSEREDLVDALWERMDAAEAKELYRKRSASIERCFGDMKLHRGLTRFLRRGLRGAKTTVGLRVLLHNGLLRINEKDKAENTTKTKTTTPDF